MNEYFDESEKQLQKDMKKFYKEKETEPIKKTPQLENGYTRVANEIVDALCTTSLSPYESQILWCIFRKTYGWNKKEDWLSNSQLVEMSGIHKAHVSRSMKLLIDRHIVTKGGNKISLQKDVAKWIKKLPKGVNTHHLLKLPKGVTPVTKGGNTVTEGGNKKLPKGAYTKDNKDTITKDTITKDKQFSTIEDLKEEHLETIAEKYLVPLSFVKSKLDDMTNWRDEKPNDKTRKNRNWKATLMNWVKKDAVSIAIKNSTANSKYAVTKV